MNFLIGMYIHNILRATQRRQTHLKDQAITSSFIHPEKPKKKNVFFSLLHRLLPFPSLQTSHHWPTSSYVWTCIHVVDYIRTWNYNILMQGRKISFATLSHAARCTGTSNRTQSLFDILEKRERLHRTPTHTIFFKWIWIQIFGIRFILFPMIQNIYIKCDILSYEAATAAAAAVAICNNILDSDEMVLRMINDHNFDTNCVNVLVLLVFFLYFLYSYRIVIAYPVLGYWLLLREWHDFQ